MPFHRLFSDLQLVKSSEILPESSVEDDVVRKQQRSLAFILDSIADGVIATDLEGRVSYMNRVAQQLTGWTLLEAFGLNLGEVFKLIDGESGVALESPFEVTMIKGRPITLAPNTVLVSRLDKRFSIEDSAAPIRDRATSPPSGMVLVFRDVTEQRKMAIELQEAKKLETIGRLAGGVAHDFNNLLAGIMGYSEMLMIELEKEPKLLGYARTILATSELAAKLTNQLLAFSRNGKNVSVPVDINSSIQATVGLLRSTTDSGVSIVTRLNAEAAMVMGDPTLLESALLNLGINARDAIASGGAIEIETKILSLDRKFIKRKSLGIEAGDYVEIEFSDTGTGMTDDVKRHLFEPFFTTKDHTRGTGLGLAAVYGTVKEHHGAITVKSAEGRGTTFKMYLPLSKLSVAEIKAEETANYSGSGCILLVDDEKMVLETASALLKNIGYEVLLAENGLEAIEIYKEHSERIKIVILDVVMPRLNGPDTFFALKNLNSAVKVIFASGYTFNNGAYELLNSGVFGFIQKPFRRETLYKAIQESLRTNQPSQEPLSLSV